MKTHLPPGEGRNWLTPLDIRRGKRDLQVEFDRAILKYVHEPLDVLNALLEKGLKLPAVEKTAIRQIVRAAEKGDSSALELVLYSAIRKRNKKSGKSGKSKPGDESAPHLPDPDE